MEDYIKETLIASPYPFWFTVLIFALTTGLVQYLVFYFREKGKNLATKEDIEEITKKIESVKTSYSKGLEQYKMELLEEMEKFTNYKENAINKNLIRLLEKTNKLLFEVGIMHDKDRNLEDVNNTLEELCRYIYTYKFIYERNKKIYIILEQYNNYTKLFNRDKTTSGHISNKTNQMIQSIHILINKALKDFIGN